MRAKCTQKVIFRIAKWIKVNKVSSDCIPVLIILILSFIYFYGNHNISSAIAGNQTNQSGVQVNSTETTGCVLTKYEKSQTNNSIRELCSLYGDEYVFR